MNTILENRIALSTEELAAYCRENQIRTLSLFGSAVTGNFTAESDIDLLVEFEPEAQIGFLALARIQRELSSLLRRRVDLVPRAGLKPLIREQVLSESQLLYAI